MFTKLEQRSWIKIEVARGHSTQEYFQGLREALHGIEPHLSSWQCKESYRCLSHGPLEQLAIGDSGTPTVLAQYEFLRLRFLRQSERTTTRDPIQHNILFYPCYRMVNKEHQQRWTRRK